jgi:hypothetical protein
LPLNVDKHIPNVPAKMMELSFFIWFLYYERTINFETFRSL